MGNDYLLKLATALQPFGNGRQVSDEDEQCNDGEDTSGNGKAAEQIGKQGRVDPSCGSANTQGGMRLVGLPLHKCNRDVI